MKDRKKPRKSKKDRKEELSLLRVQTEQGAPLSKADQCKLYHANVKERKKPRKSKQATAGK